jgi:branched-subunit amino acid aminotransferase/4-amino-4-deoxychorismate lyase
MQDLAYLNGQYVPAEELHVSVTDWGFVQGLTLAEQLRTFRGEPFRAQNHLDRLLNGATIVGWEHFAAGQDFGSIIQEIAKCNHQQLDPLDDLGICVFLTPGEYPGYGAPVGSPPTICVHSYALPFNLWHNKYETGLALVSVATRQVPANCWPAELKCRSRMHYYLAANEANRQIPGATALLLDQHGHVSETPTANVIAYFAKSGLVSPAHENILPGISLSFLVDLAGQLGVPVDFRDITPAELATADELMLTSTPYCVLPVSHFDHRSFSAPGPLFQELLRAWSHSVGVDIAAQARRFAHRH